MWDLFLFINITCQIFISPEPLYVKHIVGLTDHVLSCCEYLCLWVQVFEGGPSYYVLTPAKLGPREDTWSGGCALHSGV